MDIVKNWTTVELIEYLNSYKKASEEDKEKHSRLMMMARAELIARQPLVGWSYLL